MSYPKVLIIGQYFNTFSGSGITLINLFKGWDKQCIAVATREIKNPDFSVCEKYYQFGHLENKRRFPFNLFRKQNSLKSGIPINKHITQGDSSSNRSKIKIITYLYELILKYTGLVHRNRELIISNEFLQWINEYSPDVIYSQLSSLELIRLVNNLKQQLKIPLALHLMDDWPMTISSKGLFKSYWFKIIDREFRHLLSNADVLMSISDAMSHQYQIRYGLRFISFHNPIDINYWTIHSRKRYEMNEAFIILYAGRIGTGVQHCFLDVATAIDNLIQKGLKIEFHIQTLNFNPILKKLRKHEFVKLKEVATYEELPKIFSAADLLLLPNDFNKSSISFLRYSMPTKATEYMISGSPILVYSSIETAVAKHAQNNKWAYVVSENERIKLEKAIYEIYSDQELRRELGTSAFNYAIKNYDSEIIRNKFRNAFNININD